MRHIPRVIIEEHNLFLMKPIELEEVDTVVKTMENDKSLRPLGLLPTSSMTARTG